ncbi:MAG: maleylpyruvate isomerase N-terminal domain-containing protein [Actinobacteria bacterium]|nr:maleylpyruvate isomerase N-terminal domain-containing protein [Actinomycetota bacterium]
MAPEVAGRFSQVTQGVQHWDAPTPVAGWTARDVVGHLTGWFPGFLQAGAGVELARGPSVDDADVQSRLIGFIGRDPAWSLPGQQHGGAEGGD